MSKKLPLFPILLIGGVFLIGATTLAFFASSYEKSSIPLPFTRPSPTITPTQSNGTITLQKDVPQTLPDTALTLTLTSVSIPSKNCRDCIARAIISVRKSTDETTITYTAGGFTGKIPKAMTAFGYSFTVKNLDSNSVILSYEK